MPADENKSQELRVSSVTCMHLNAVHQTLLTSYQRANVNYIG